MKYSWGKNHSLLFIDNPVGTGFSFTDDDRGYSTNQTTVTARFIQSKYNIFILYIKKIENGMKFSIFSQQII